MEFDQKVSTLILGMSLSHEKNGNAILTLR